MQACVTSSERRYGKDHDDNDDDDDDYTRRQVSTRVCPHRLLIFRYLQ